MFKQSLIGHLVPIAIGGRPLSYGQLRCRVEFPLFLRKKREEGGFIYSSKGRCKSSSKVRHLALLGVDSYTMCALCSSSR